MSFTIPDKGTGDNDIQSILFKEYIDVLLAGIQGIDCVLFGLGVTGGANMTPSVAKGAVISNNIMYPVAAGTATITSAHATLPRVDLIVITSAGAIAVREGSAATAPKPPARTANDVVIASVWIPAADTAIATTQCTDMRVFAILPVVIKKVTTAVVVNNNNAIATYLTCTMPSGLMSAGRVARVRCGGTYLFNAATQPTPILTISYGGSSMWVDTGLLSTADVDRGAWRLDFDIIAQGSADQQLIGFGIMTNTITAAHVPPTTGQAGNLVGSLAVANRPVSWEMAAALAIDSDAANRDLLVRWTMGGTASASNEMTMEFATVELL
jgi:hypothetical protein